MEFRAKERTLENGAKKRGPAQLGLNALSQLNRYEINLVYSVKYTSLDTS